MNSKTNSSNILKKINNYSNDTTETVLNKEEINYLVSNQNELIQTIKFCLTSDNYLATTKMLWETIEEENNELVKYELYAYLLNQEVFNIKTARFVCLKERNLKNLGSNLLSKCGSVKAIKFVIGVYGFNNNNIVDAITCCIKSENIIIMNYLLSLITLPQQRIALTRLMNSFLSSENEKENGNQDIYEIEVEVIRHLLHIQKDWNNVVLQNDKIKSLLFFNKIDSKIGIKEHNRMSSCTVKI